VDLQVATDGGAARDCRHRGAFLVVYRFSEAFQ
jgi:hypothetical protein